MAKDCPKSNETKKPFEKKKEEPKKMNGKDLYTHIQAIYKEMPEEEQNKFMKQVEEAGF